MSRQEISEHPSAMHNFDTSIPFALVQEHRVLRVFPLGDRLGEAGRELREMVLDTFFSLELLLQPETRRTRILQTPARKKKSIHRYHTRGDGFHLSGQIV